MAGDAGACARRGLDLELATDALRAFAHHRQAEPARPVQVKTIAIIADAQAHPAIGQLVQAELDTAGMGVADDVGQAFLGDADWRDLDGAAMTTEKWEDPECAGFELRLPAGNGGTLRLRYDEDMTGEYYWDQPQTPACPAPVPEEPPVEDPEESAPPAEEDPGTAVPPDEEPAPPEEPQPPISDEQA